MHKRCLEIRKCLTKAVDFERRKCYGFTGSIEIDEELTIDGDVIKQVANFLYLGDVLSFGGGVQEAVIAAIRFLM